MLTRFKQVMCGLDIALLILAVAAMLVTFVMGYTAFVTIADRCIMFDTIRGELSIWTAPVQPGSAKALRHYSYHAGSGVTVEQIFARWGDSRDSLSQTFGFGYGRTNMIFGGPPVANGRWAYLVVTPYWFIILLLSIAPVRWIAKRMHAPLRRRRPRRGFVPAMRV